MIFKLLFIWLKIIDFELTEHIDVRFHFIRDAIEEGTIKVLNFITDDYSTDMLTKIVSLAKFAHCMDLREYASTNATLREELLCGASILTKVWFFLFLTMNFPIILNVLSRVVQTHAWNANQLVEIDRIGLIFVMTQFIKSWWSLPYPPSRKTKP